LTLIAILPTLVTATVSGGRAMANAARGARRSRLVHGDGRHANPVTCLIAGAALVACLACALEPGRGPAPRVSEPIPTDPDLKVAFIGDSGDGPAFTRVLELIKSEGAHVLLHQGDFDYADNARRFFRMIAGRWQGRRDGMAGLRDLQGPGRDHRHRP
jgi:hypothetical protein